MISSFGRNSNHAGLSQYFIAKHLFELASEDDKMLFLLLDDTSVLVSQTAHLKSSRNR